MTRSDRATVGRSGRFEVWARLAGYWEGIAVPMLWLVTLVGGWGVVGPPSWAQEAPNSEVRPELVLPPLTVEELAEAKGRLAALGYWLEPLATPASESFRQALLAFQKVEGRPRTGKLTTIELQVLRQAQPPTPLERGDFHLEVDLERQVVLVVDPDGVVVRTVSTSTGSGELFTEGGRTRRATTPTGRFQIFRKIAGWRTSPLGRLYYPLYFIGGTALHGSPSIPAQPASHGCVRLPMTMAREFFRLVPMGTPVLVYLNQATPPPSTPASTLPEE